MDPKVYTKACNWAGCMAPCLGYKKAPYQIIMPILLVEMVPNNQKTGFYAVFFNSVAIWAPPSEPKKVDKGPQIG
jgi:hypothetical protein